jgi:hypothetical protein
MRRWLWLNGLALVSFGGFAIFLVGQSLVGWHAYNDDLQQVGMPALSLLAYLGSGHFVEATTENWESEFLQMGAYVVLTAMLVQRGSPESNPPDQPKDDDPSDPKQIKADSPPPVHRGGLALKLYENSLSITLFGLFALSFVLHLLGGTAEENVERRSPASRRRRRRPGRTEPGRHAPAGGAGPGPLHPGRSQAGHPYSGRSRQPRPLPRSRAASAVEPSWLTSIPFDARVPQGVSAKKGGRNDGSGTLRPPARPNT